MKKLFLASIAVFGFTVAPILTSAQNITANFSFPSSSQCFGNSICFTDLSTSTFPITQWSWSFGDGGSSTQQNPCNIYLYANTFTVTLIITNSNGEKDTVQHPVTVNPLPTSSFVSTTVCNGDITCFTDISTISSGNIISWSWNFDDPGSGPANISNLQNPCHLYSTTGAFNVVMTVTSDSGCQSTIILPVIVNSPPTASVTANPSTITTGNSSTITTIASGGTPPYTYNWSFGNTYNPIVISPTITTCYTVTVVDVNGCADSASICVTVNPVGINDYIKDISFSISPNPFSIQTTLHSDDFLHNATLTVDNCFGQTVAQIKNISGQSIVFHRGNLPSGVYFVRLTTPSPQGEGRGEVYTGKFIITDN